MERCRRLRLSQKARIATVFVLARRSARVAEMAQLETEVFVVEEEAHPLLRSLLAYTVAVPLAGARPVFAVWQVPLQGHLLFSAQLCRPALLLGSKPTLLAMKEARNPLLPVMVHRQL